jgi:hypothetical protein
MEAITIYRNKEGMLENTSKGDVGKKCRCAHESKKLFQLLINFCYTRMLYDRLVNAV